MMYMLFDAYGEEFITDNLICKSDDYAEIKLAIKQYIKDTDGECSLWLAQKVEKKGYNLIQL